MRQRGDVPDSMNVLDGVADLLAKLFLIKLHLQNKKGTTGRFVYTFLRNFSITFFQTPCQLITINTLKM